MNLFWQSLYSNFDHYRVKVGGVFKNNDRILKAMSVSLSFFLPVARTKIDILKRIGLASCASSSCALLILVC
jgi:hypothetical protein